jgi:multiple sugar transport system permease protein
MKRTKTPYLLIAPAFLLAFVIVIFPLVFTVRNSFLNWNLQTSPVPLGSVGFTNYRLALSDPTFFAAFRNTMVITFVGTAIEFLLGLVLALLLYEELKGTNKIRAVVIMPMTVAPIVAGLMFRFLFYNNGLIPYFLRQIGVGVPGQGVLGHASTVLIGPILTNVWQWTPFFAIIMLAGFQSIPDEQIECAIVDGAGYFRRLRSILLPNLNFVAVIIVMIRFMMNFNIFDIIYAQTRGGPGLSSRTLSYNLYYAGLVEFNMGFASALAVIMIIIVVAIINIFATVLFRGKEI